MTATWPSSPMVLKSVSMMTFGGLAKQVAMPISEKSVLTIILETRIVFWGVDFDLLNALPYSSATT
jgi:hypothetical protein